MKDSHKIFLYYLPLILLLSFFIIVAANHNLGDFAGYYFGSKELLAGKYSVAYDTEALNILITKNNIKGEFVSYTPFPPSTSLIFIPFLLFPVFLSKIVFNIFSSIIFLYSLNRAFKYYSIRPSLLLVIPFVFFIPIRNNIFFGQSYLLLLVLLLEGFVAYKNDKLLLSSLLWSIAILFKIFPVLIILFLLLRKEYRNIFYLLLFCSFWFILSLILNGILSWSFYLQEIFPRLNNGELNDSFTFIFQSMFMLLKNIFIHDDLLQPKPLYNNIYLFVLSYAIFKAVIITFCFIITKRRDVERIVAFSFWILVSILISPNGSSYSLILLLIPFIAFASKYGFENWAGKFSLILIFFIANFPVHYLNKLPLLLQFPRLYFLLIFFIVLIFKSGIKINFKVFSFIFIFFLVADSLKLFPGKDKSTYYLSEEKHILICNYEVRDKQIVYHYWDKNGMNKYDTHYLVNNFSIKGLKLKNNQIFFNERQLTNSSDWKKKPVLINGSFILYLSDKNRGVGFYTLRKINLDVLIPDLKSIN